MCRKQQCFKISGKVMGTKRRNRLDGFRFKTSHRSEGGRFGKPEPKPPPDSATTQFDSNSTSTTRNRLITVREAERIPRIKNVQAYNTYR